MRWTKTLIPTLRQTPAEAVVPSHQLMLRAGIIQQVASGAYSYLPLGCRALHKAMTIVREEMDRAGASEVFMPSLQPIEWWEKTGRRAAYGENLLVVTDRHGREQALGPTHEEVITQLVGSFVESYRQLPLNLYQIQTKFRDEFRPRFGVLRSREFQMKDAYSFHLDLDSLNETYEAMRAAYRNIFTRCGLKFVEVEAEAGPIGGNASHEFMVPCPTGEDVILSDDQSDYAANVEKAETGPRKFELEGEPTGELEKVHTPNQASIEDVCKFMKVKPKNMLKTLVLRGGDKWIVAVVRGDHELNEGKLKAAAGVTELEMADEAEAKAAGFAIGFVGPHVAAGRNDVEVVADFDAAQGQFWATGANEADHHVKHFNWKRDVLRPGMGAKVQRLKAVIEGKPGTGGKSHQFKLSYKITVADIRNAVDGDPSPRSAGSLRESKGIEIGHVFKLGTKYTQALDVTVLDAQQKNRPLIMGCYGIGINRILAAAIEYEGGHDDAGIIWPMALAPYHVVITPIKYQGEAQRVADDLYEKLTAAGLDVLLDDRDERPGVKFKDADLIGIPLRITIGDKGLANHEVEFKPRTADKAEMVNLDAIADRTIAAVMGR